MEEKNRISVLFSKYVANDANKAEVAELLDLIRDEQSGPELNTEMEHLWNKQNAVADDVDWQRIYNIAVASDPEVKSGSSRSVWLSAAAMFVGICSVALWLNMHKSFSTEAARYVTGKAKAGRTMIVYLGDGTRVTLNSGSELRYPESFDGDKREVYLNGEAYFEVAHDAAKSFLVHSGKVVTSVLGTSFNVMAYAGMSKMSVTVLTGKVAVKNTSTEKLVTLLPQQRASLSIGKNVFAVDSVKDVAEMIAWRKGELIFTNATLEEIALKLGNRYGIRIIVSNNDKKEKRITGTFNKQSFIEIMNAVTRLTQTNYKQTEENYTIY
jgi:transmembrane sensor